jgi:hypothetical protein
MGTEKSVSIPDSAIVSGWRHAGANLTGVDVRPGQLHDEWRV